MNDWCSAPLQVCTPGTLRSWLLDPFLCQAAVATLATRAVPQHLRSSVFGRSTLTLPHPVDHLFSLTLFHPVGCDSALLLWPTTVLHIFLQRTQRLMSPTVPCPHCFQLWWRSVWSGHRRVPRWYVVQEGGAYGTSGPNSTKTPLFQRDSFLMLCRVLGRK